MCTTMVGDLGLGERNSLASNEKGSLEGKQPGNQKSRRLCTMGLSTSLHLLRHRKGIDSMAVVSVASVAEKAKRKEGVAASDSSIKV